jgi:8-oxo-dGTP pyrophosphatase MutT (NUDIX family)
MSERAFEKISERIAYDGRILKVAIDEYRFPDGEVAEREIVRHPGVAAIVVHDGRDLLLTRQPREAVSDPDSLEIPAGRLDKPGESPALAAARELAEEVGKRAGKLEHLKTYFAGVGSSDEAVHLYLATHLSDHSEDSGENERIEIVHWPLSDIDGAIDATWDAKTLIGLMLLRERLRRA